MISGNISGAQAYAAAQGVAGAGVTGDGGDTSFGGVLQKTITGLETLAQEADTQAAAGLTGKGNMTDVVMAVSNAETALQATVAVRDKVVSAYQEIMRMAV